MRENANSNQNFIWIYTYKYKIKCIGNIKKKEEEKGFTKLIRKRVWKLKLINRVKLKRKKHIKF